jgi:broad specificity phosphatase PhoE
VLASFSEPHVAAAVGWEPLDVTRARVRLAAQDAVARADRPVVLVGHGTAFTLLVADLTGQPPDLDGWSALSMPDHCVLSVDPEVGRAEIATPWGAWAS